MKYLYLLLLLSLYTCSKNPPSCLELTEEDVSLQLEVQHNITEQSIDALDTIELSITFPKNLINTVTSSTFDISTQEPRFALFIRGYDEESRFEERPIHWPPAKEEFDYSILAGEEIPVSRYFFSPAEEEAINIRPALSNDQYTLSIQLSFPHRLGPYALYWNFLQKDFLLTEGDDLSNLPSCKDFIKVKINNPGVANLELAGENSVTAENAATVEDFGLLLFKIKN